MSASIAFAADQIVTIANIVIVPAERAYTSVTMLSTKPPIVSGTTFIHAIIRFSAVSDVYGSTAQSAIRRGTRDKNRKNAALAANALIFFRVICPAKSFMMKTNLIIVLKAIPLV